MSSMDDDEQYARDLAKAVELSKRSATEENERRKRYINGNTTRCLYLFDLC